MPNLARGRYSELNIHPYFGGGNRSCSGKGGLLLKKEKCLVFKCRPSTVQATLNSNNEEIGNWGLEGYMKGYSLSTIGNCLGGRSSGSGLATGKTKSSGQNKGNTPPTGSISVYGHQKAGDFATKRSNLQHTTIWQWKSKTVVGSEGGGHHMLRGGVSSGKKDETKNAEKGTLRKPNSLPGRLLSYLEKIPNPTYLPKSRENSLLLLGTCNRKETGCS